MNTDTIIEVPLYNNPYQEPHRIGNLCYTSTMAEDYKNEWFFVFVYSFDGINYFTDWKMFCEIDNRNDTKILCKKNGILGYCYLNNDCIADADIPRYKFVDIENTGIILCEQRYDSHSEIVSDTKIEKDCKIPKKTLVLQHT